MKKEDIIVATDIWILYLIKEDEGYNSPIINHLECIKEYLKGTT